MSTEQNVLLIALESIKNDNLTLLDRALRVMPLEKLVDKHETLLSSFLDLCADYNRPEASKMILDRWKVIYPDNEKISMLSRLFMKQIILVNSLAFLVSIHPDYTFVELIDELSEWDSDEGVVTACERAEQIFGDQPYDTYLILKDRAVELGNFRVEEYLIDKISEVAPFAPKPDYVNNYLFVYYPQFDKRLPTQTELENLIVTPKEQISFEMDDDSAVALLTEGLGDAGVTLEEIEIAKGLIRKEIAKSEERKRELLLPILKNKNQLNLETDKLLYWIYGPTNPLVNQDLTLDTPSAKYGGCRMFLCNLFDYNEEEGYFEDWFLGHCEECLLRISNRYWSVRMPREHGGWQGCFCSWKCVKDRQSFLETGIGPNLLLRTMIQAFETKTKEIGIQNREL